MGGASKASNEFPYQIRERLLLRQNDHSMACYVKLQKARQWYLRNFGLAIFYSIKAPRGGLISKQEPRGVPAPGRREKL